VEKQMNKNVLCLIPTVIFAAACGQQQLAAGPAGDDDPATPEDIVLPDDCEEIELRDCPNPRPEDPRPEIQIQIIDTAGTQKIDIVPDTICAANSDVLEFKIIGPPADEGSVAILPKDAVNSWLVGTNYPDEDRIKIFIPSFVASGDHFFAIVTSTGLCVDPRVHVW
jgi:hypothetical protein